MTEKEMNRTLQKIKYMHISVKRIPEEVREKEEDRNIFKNNG